MHHLSVRTKSISTSTKTSVIALTNCTIRSLRAMSSPAKRCWNIDSCIHHLAFTIKMRASGLEREHIMYLEPATPPSPTTSASLSSPRTRSISRSSPNHTHQAIYRSPGLLDIVLIELDRHETMLSQSIDQKRKRHAEECVEFMARARGRGMHIGVEIETHNSVKAVAVPECSSQRSAVLRPSRVFGSAGGLNGHTTYNS